MVISVINKTESKNISIPATAVIGGAAGLALRQVLPVYKEEIDSVLFQQTDKIRTDKLETAKNAFISTTKKLFSKNKNNEALKLFIKRVEAKTVKEAKLAKEKIKNAPQNVQAEVKKQMGEFLTKMKAEKHLSEANIKHLVKQERPFAPFILPGIALGAAVAYVYNVVGKISEY